MESSIINIVRIKDGLFVEEWKNFDVLSFIGALGFELKPKTK